MSTTSRRSTYVQEEGVQGGGAGIMCVVDSLCSLAASAIVHSHMSQAHHKHG